MYWEMKLSFEKKGRIFEGLLVLFDLCDLDLFRFIYPYPIAMGDANAKFMGENDMFHNKV